MHVGLGLNLGVGLGVSRPASGAYEQVFVRFDGSTDMFRNPTETAGAWMTDGTGFTWSAWVRFKGGFATTQTLLGNASNFRLDFGVEATTARMRWRVFNTAGTQLGNNYVSAALSNDTLYHLILAVDSATPAIHCYVNDVAQTTYTLTTGTMALNGGSTRITAWANGWGGITQACNAEVADWWMDDSFIDISVEANRRKFISAAGAPVFLGANGELPTGSAPAVHFGGSQTAADWNAADNLGTATNIEVIGTVV